MVYSGVFGAVLASIPAIRSHVVTFDTTVVDLTEKMSDPVGVLIGVQLGGGTDINRALAYCPGLITRPRDTTDATGRRGAELSTHRPRING